MTNIFLKIGSGLALVSLGLMGGYYAAIQVQRGGGGGEAAKEDDPGHPHGPGGHTHGQAQKPEDDGHKTLPPQTLKNLGVVVGKASLGAYTRYLEVQAEVENAPLSDRPLVAPIGGFVRHVHKSPGEVAAAGDVLVTLVRDPIPRPEWKVIGGFLKPVNETLHHAYSELRAAHSRVQVLTTEIERLEALNKGGTQEGLPLVSGQRLVDLRYELTGARQKLENVRTELAHHGLTKGDIGGMEAGKHPPHSLDLWQRVLVVHGLWTKNVAALHQLLPEKMRKLPWIVGTLGELAAAGLVTDELVSATKATPAMRTGFAEVCSLLIAGSPVDRVQLLAAQGALEPVVKLRAPTDSGDWDVGTVAVRVGQHVGEGTVLLRLNDPRQVWLRLHPIGSEVSALAVVLEKDLALAARPLTRGTGPELKGLRLDRLSADSHRGRKRTSAVIRCDNRPLPQKRADGQRSWQLRAGMRYVVHVPVQTFEKVFVLPKGALTDDGPNRVVFVKEKDKGSNEEHFHHHAVHVLYEDSESVVIANDGALEPDEPVVTKGAFALSQALQVGANAPDPHAGHKH